MLRPSFAALVAAEEELGPLFALVERAADGRLALGEGMQVIRLADRARICYDGGEWTPPETIAAPSGGTVIDVEARAALAALILSLEAQGLMISG